MRKRVLIVAAAVVLMVVLAVPASASNAIPIQGTIYYVGDFLDFGATQVGDRCLVHSVALQTWTGSIEGTSVYHYRSLSKGAADCNAGPIYDETTQLEGVIDATIAGRQGTISYTCEGQHHVAKDNYWKGHCVVQDATDELAGLRGRFETFMPLETMVASYKGVLHFGEE